MCSERIEEYQIEIFYDQWRGLSVRFGDGNGTSYEYQLTGGTPEASLDDPFDRVNCRCVEVYKGGFCKADEQAPIDCSDIRRVHHDTGEYTVVWRSQ